MKFKKIKYIIFVFVILINIIIFNSTAYSDCASCFTLFKVKIELKNGAQTGYIIEDNYRLSFQEFKAQKKDSIYLLKNFYISKDENVILSKSKDIPYFMFYAKEDNTKISSKNIVSIRMITQKELDGNIKILPKAQVDLLTKSSVSSVYSWYDDDGSMTQIHTFLSYNKDFTKEVLDKIVKKHLFQKKGWWHPLDLKAWEAKLKELEKINVLYFVTGDGC